MKITGQILKENRERKGISLNEVAIATKINVRTLQAMEEGDLAQLPPKTFLRGFVRSYASYLEMNVDSVLNTFFDEMGTTNPKVTTTPEPDGQRLKSSPNEADEAINPKTSLTTRIAVAAVILFVVVMIVLVKKKMESYERETIVEDLPPEIGSIVSNGEGAPPSVNETGVAAALSTPEPAATPEPTPTPMPTATPIATPIATPTPTTPVPMPTPTPTPAPTATPTPTPVPTPTPPGPTATPEATPAQAVRAQEVIIEALDGVEIEAQIDGESTKKIKLKAEQVQSIKARRKIILNLSDGGAVNIIVNGVERGVPGDLGKPLRLELP